MKFYILKEDYSSGPFGSAGTPEGPQGLFFGTSVLAYKRWFIENIRKFGRIIPLDEALGEKRLSLLLSRPDSIFLSINTPEGNINWSKVRFRLLHLSRGSFLLPENFFRMNVLPSAQVHLVSTRFQLERMKLFLGSDLAKMEVFPPRVDSGFYVPPDARQRREARKKYGIHEKQLHIVYAGRWVVTKGICQLVRMLDIWPGPGIVITMAGDIEEANTPAFSTANHKTFKLFLRDEILRDKRRGWLRLHKSKSKEELRELFWSADLFVNPSVQPDENFGITPREAVSCGIGAVTTNFCGLRPLAENMPWRGVDTYPTPAGSRFSLKVFRDKLQEAAFKRNLISGEEYHDRIAGECDARLGTDNLRAAIDYLRRTPAQRPSRQEEIEARMKRRFFSNTDSRSLKGYLNSRKELSPGAYVHGDRPGHYAFTLVQGVFSALDFPPEVEKNTRWRGFFRIGLWPRESALVEFGFPGPRVRRYTKRLWNSLVKCAYYQSDNEAVIIPKDNTQVQIVQELVGLGYFVPD